MGFIVYEIGVVVIKKEKRPKGDMEPVTGRMSGVSIEKRYPSNGLNFAFIILLFYGLAGKEGMRFGPVPQAAFSFLWDRAYINFVYNSKAGGRVGLKNKMNEFFQRSSLKPLDIIIILFFTLAIAKVFSLYFSVENDEKDWEKFKVENHCKLKLGDKGYESSTWVCDNGSVYYGWRQQR